jgi:hypothetical protein
MSWGQSFSVHFGPGAYAGIRVGNWLRVLRDNVLAVDRRYWGRLAFITLASVPNTLVSCWEDLVYGRAVRRTMAEPLFILGAWRSGTTYLHTLLAQDDRLAYPNFFECAFPNTFLSTEWAGTKLLGAFLGSKRLQDDVAVGVREPHEDEFALCSLTGRSLMMSLSFPDNADRYGRYLTLRDLSEGERAEWRAALGKFVRKLAYRYRRPVVLKSPGHTCRIRLLLELFPNARFVHIHRNPYKVFQSNRHTIRKLAPAWALQRHACNHLDDYIIRRYKEVYDAFFEERGLIPKGRFHEVGFEQLEADPLGQVRRLYEALDLGDFGQAELPLRRHLDAIAGYRKNTFPELPPDLRARLAREWRRCFEEWGYPIEPEIRAPEAAAS